ncbi:MAG: hypothetical protein ACRD6N_06560, partial [Pyrinomonadaceae bacterium]
LLAIFRRLATRHLGSEHFPLTYGQCAPTDTRHRSGGNEHTESDLVQTVHREPRLQADTHMPLMI